MAEIMDGVAPTKQNTDTSFSDMLNQKTNLDSVQEIVKSKGLSKSKKMIMLAQLGYSMEDAKKLVETFKPKEDTPPDEMFLDSDKAKKEPSSHVPMQPKVSAPALAPAAPSFGKKMKKGKMF
jgi:hypothetical protein